MRAKSGGAVTGVMVRDQVLPPALRAALLRTARSSSGTPAAIEANDGGGVVVQDEVRRVWEIGLPDSWHDALVGAVEAWRADLEAWCGQALAPCEAVAALHYPPGAFYLTHRDVNDRATDPRIARRVLSVVLFVNDGDSEPSFDGGVLHLVAEGGAEAVELRPVAGRCVAFPAQRLHEVTPVTRGHRVTVVTWLLAAE